MKDTLNVNIKRKEFKNNFESISSTKKDIKKSNKLVFGTFSKAIDYAPYYIAKNLKWFSKLGMEVQHKEYDDLDKLEKSLRNNEVDVIFGADSAILSLQRKGINLNYIGVNSGLTQHIIVKNNSKIFKISDLIGKKVGVLKGTSSHYGVLKILESKGIDINDIKLIFLTLEKAKEEFEKGTIDAWAVWPPFMDEQIIKNKAKILNETAVYISSIIASREDIFLNNKKSLIKILKIIDKSKNWIKSNPLSAQEKIKTELNIPLKIIKFSWENHNFQIDTSTNVVIADLSFKVQPTEIVTILGPSGCGKSTLLKMISGLDIDFDGFIEHKKNKIISPNKESGIMFQEHRLIPWLTVEENVSFGMENENHNAVENILKMLEIDNFVKSYPKQLSGGMAQRVALARALVNIPSLLLLDEPFSSLDVITKNNLLKELSEILKKKKTTTLMVTHNIEEAVMLSDRILVMSSRPASIIRNYKINLPKPRDRNNKVFIELVEKIHNDLSRELKLI